MTSKQSVKVYELRKKGYTDFQSWLKGENNVYVGRTGRIWITQEKNIIFHKNIFYYKASKWANPFKVTDECSLEESLDKYIDYIVQTGLIYDIHELKGKTLGCWCTSSKCHATILCEIADGKYLEDFF